jgi:hypothetical protein
MPTWSDGPQQCTPSGVSIHRAAPLYGRLWLCCGRKENVHVSPEATDSASLCRHFWTKFQPGTIRFCSQEIPYRTHQRSQFQINLHRCQPRRTQSSTRPTIMADSAWT